MPNTLEALQILVVMIPGFVSFMVAKYFGPTKERSIIEYIVIAAIFAGVDWAIYKLIESKFPLEAIRNLLSLERTFDLKYCYSMAVLMIIAFLVGFFFIKILSIKKVSSFLHKLKVKS